MSRSVPSPIKGYKNVYRDAINDQADQEMLSSYLERAKVHDDDGDGKISLLRIEQTMQTVIRKERHGYNGVTMHAGYLIRSF
jgi:hypothetical protein